MSVQIKTSDLYFAAYLQSIGCEIIGTENDKGKNFFTFEDKEERSDLTMKYFNEAKESSTPALNFANSIRSLKTLCHVK